ncbi:MAG: response regulator [Thermoguttaceae bacterium]|nr:response regulator [Thermoguttaceae bacterium]
MLIVDDDQAFRETLCSIFEPRGFDIFQAECGEQALSIAREKTVDVGMFDFHMPRLSGLETIRQIRIIQPSLPCFLMSAALDDAIRQEASQLANSAATLQVLSKPVSLRTITSLVLTALQMSGR